MSEKKRGAPEHARGAQPIRKRGYYRAIERGEIWALSKKAVHDFTTEICSRLLKDMLGTNPFIKMIGDKNGNEIQGLSSYIPIRIGLRDGALHDPGEDQNGHADDRSPEDAGTDEDGHRSRQTSGDDDN